MRYLRKEAGRFRYDSTFESEVMIELVIDMDFDQMTAAVLDYFKPDYKSDDEITSWYERFLFYKDRIPIFYYSHYDMGDFREYLKGVNER